MSIRTSINVAVAASRVAFVEVAGGAAGADGLAVGIHLVVFASRETKADFIGESLTMSLN